MATKGLGDIQVGIRMREAIKRITTAVVNEIRPEDRIGKVFSINFDSQTAQVLFPGETIDSLVTAHFSTNTAPRVAMISTFDSQGYNAPCDVVRVSGKPGSYWISEFVSGRPQSLASRLFTVGGYATSIFSLGSLPNNNVVYPTHQYVGIPWPGEADIACVTWHGAVVATTNAAGWIYSYATNTLGTYVQLAGYQMHNQSTPARDMGHTFTHMLPATGFRTAGGTLNFEIRMSNDIGSGSALSTGLGAISVSFLGVD